MSERLFDDYNPKNRGKGVDRKGGKGDGLERRWMWSMICERSWPGGGPQTKDEHRTPGQVCYTDWIRVDVAGEEQSYRFEAIYWYSEYEAVVEEYNSPRLASRRGFKTRVDAQRGAEQLMAELATALWCEFSGGDGRHDT